MSKTDVFRAVKVDLVTLRAALDQHPEQLETPCGQLKMTPLVKAASANKPDAVKLLLECGADALVKINDEPFLAIATTAAFMGGYSHVLVLRLLLDHLADKLGRQGLADLVTEYDLNGIYHLVEKKKVKQDRAALVTAMLLRYGADQSNQKKGWKPLHVAARYGLWRIQAVLQQNSLCQIDAPKEDGFFPVFLAASNGNPESLLLLLEHGANPSPICDGNEAIDKAEGPGITAVLHRAKIRQVVLQAIAEGKRIPEEPPLPTGHLHRSGPGAQMGDLLQLLAMLMR